MASRLGAAATALTLPAVVAALLSLLVAAPLAAAAPRPHAGGGAAVLPANALHRLCAEEFSSALSAGAPAGGKARFASEVARLSASLSPLARRNASRGEVHAWALGDALRGRLLTAAAHSRAPRGALPPPVARREGGSPVAVLQGLLSAAQNPPGGAEACAALPAEAFCVAQRVQAGLGAALHGLAGQALAALRRGCILIEPPYNRTGGRAQQQAALAYVDAARCGTRRWGGCYFAPLSSCQAAVDAAGEGFASRMPVLPPSEVSEHAEYIARATRARHGLAASGAVGELEIAAGALGYLMRPGDALRAEAERWAAAAGAAGVDFSSTRVRVVAVHVRRGDKHEGVSHSYESYAARVAEACAELGECSIFVSSDDPSAHKHFRVLARARGRVYQIPADAFAVDAPGEHDDGGRGAFDALQRGEALREGRDEGLVLLASLQLMAARTAAVVGTVSSNWGRLLQSMAFASRDDGVDCGMRCTDAIGGEVEKGEGEGVPLFSISRWRFVDMDREFWFSGTYHLRPTYYAVPGAGQPGVPTACASARLATDQLTLVPPLAADSPQLAPAASMVERLMATEPHSESQNGCSAAAADSRTFPSASEPMAASLTTEAASALGRLEAACVSASAAYADCAQKALDAVVANQGKCVRVCVAPCKGAIECLAAMPALLAAAVEASCTLTLRPAPLAALERYFLPLSSCGSSDNPEELRFEISEASAAAPSPLASGLQRWAMRLHPAPSDAEASVPAFQPGRLALWLDDGSDGDRGGTAGLSAARIDGLLRAVRLCQVLGCARLHLILPPDALDFLVTSCGVEFACAILTADGCELVAAEDDGAALRALLEAFAASEVVLADIASPGSAGAVLARLLALGAQMLRVAGAGALDARLRAELYAL